MSFAEKTDDIRPAGGEVPFSLDEVFFSRTDARGVILSGNQVFRRVAGHDWDDLLGAPHRIVRHPDMPRALFWLLWNRIQKGAPTGAYVKNRARDGRHYWVYALVMPENAGYLSARIKPTSALFPAIAAEYAALRRAELAEDLAPEEGAHRLLGRLAALGYPDYDAFTARALPEELIARDQSRGRPPRPRTEALRDALDHARALRHETEGLIADFNAMRTVPHNLRVIASRLEPTGGPISTLSKNYGIMSHDMFDWFEAHVTGSGSNFSGISAAMTETLMIDGLSRLLDACQRQIAREQTAPDPDAPASQTLEGERDILHALAAAHADRASAAARQVGDAAQRILGACDTVERHVLGLSTTRVMCKIEAARLPQSGESLTDIISQLKVFQDAISTRLDRIMRLGGEILERLA